MTSHPDPAEWSNAFAWAASARDAATSIIERVRSAEVTLAEAFAIADADPLAGRVFAVKVFEAVPEIGKVRARRTMAAIGLAEDVSLAGVLADERSRIGEEFGKLA